MKTQTIFIVDDEPANIVVLSELLKPYYNIRAANSANNAIKLLSNSTPPDLILLDIMMPEMDGYSLLQHLRNKLNLTNVPTIFVTALSDETDEKRGLDLGAVDYISKPIKPAIALARIKTQLKLKEDRDRMEDQNSWLETQVRKRIHENIVIQDVTLNALTQLAETRDSDTGHHIQRTQSYVEILARHLSRHKKFRDQLTEIQQQHIVKAAPLHDIGKVAIPDKILLKPGKLTQDEFELMKTHAEIGGKTISRAIRKAMDLYKDSDEEISSAALTFLTTAQDIAMFHHEKWDGTGYPVGLAGEAIPLSARLMAVADVYDAMSSKRVYKAASEHDEVVKTIKELSGSHFDPDIVGVFLSTLQEFIKIQQRLTDVKD